MYITPKENEKLQYSVWYLFVNSNHSLYHLLINRDFDAKLLQFLKSFKHIYFMVGHINCFLSFQ